MEQVVRILAAVFLFCSAAHAVADDVGATEDSFSVSPSGAAEFSIPISLPSGIAGMEPRLAIGYSNVANNGLVGFGWDVSGLSSISRCKSTLAQDGLVAPVNRTMSDRFCLGDNKLKVISGNYGASGSVYETEIQTFNKITANSSGALGWIPSSGPQWFQVHSPNGNIVQYGGTDDSRIEFDGTAVVRTWAISRITDTSGNYIRFVYAKEAGSYRPIEIYYTGTPQGEGLYRIAFTYELKPAVDVRQNYLAGSQIKQPYRLTSIAVLYNSANVHQYSLSYKPASGVTTQRSLLESVTECAGSDCFPPTTISWQNGTKGFAVPTSASPSLATTTLRLLDVNGDGRDDVLSSYAGQLKLRLGLFDGTLGAASSIAYSDAYFSSSLALDIDGDGRGDLLIPNSTATNWTVLKSNGSTLVSTATTVPITGALTQQISGDVNGDGRDDLVWVEGQYLKGRFSTGNTFEATVRTLYDVGVQAEGKVPTDFQSGLNRRVIRRADFNGDGRTDFLLLSIVKEFEGEGGGVTKYYYWNALTSQGDSYTSTAVTMEEAVEAPAPLLLDANGDGNTDVAYRSGSTLVYCLSKGDGTFSTVNTGISVPSAISDALLFDYDGDGRQDIVYKNGTVNWRIVKANATSFDLPVDISTSEFPISGATAVLESNGDRQSDLAYYDSGYGTWRTQIHSGAAADLATTFTDGLGNYRQVTYAALTDPSVHTKSSGSLFPVRDFQAPQYVVRQIVSNDGVGGTYSLTYSYLGAKVHVQGRGYLGFAQRSVVDSRNGVKRVRDFYQEFPWTTMPSLVRVIVPGGTSGYIVSEQSLAKATVDYGSGTTARSFPYASPIVSTERDDDGALRRTVSRSVVYNTMFGITNETIEVTDPATNVWRKVITNQFDTASESSTWCLARPTNISIVMTQPDGSSATRTASLDQNYNRCNLRSATAMPGALEVATTYGYDSYGNVRSIDVVPYGEPLRRTSISYAPNGYRPTSYTNALDHVIQLQWDYGKGVVQQLTDANNLTISWQYDGFGRVFYETRPDTSTTSWSYSWCSLGCGLSNGKYKIYTAISSAGSFGGSAYEIYDYKNRPIQSSRKMLGGADSYTLNEYDPIGRVYRTSEPYYSGGVVYWNTFDYDVLDRVTQVGRPLSESQANGRNYTFAYSVYGGQSVETMTSPASQSTTRYSNAMGAVVRVVDALNNDMYFGYWPFGELKSVTDDVGNIVSRSYDGWGHLSNISDPDMGASSYSFNGLGELKSMTNARSQITTYKYDKLGRPKLRTEADGETKWQYDIASGKGIGELAEVDGPGNYTEYRVYDGLGRTAELSMEIGNSFNAVSFEYDNFSRISTLTYPTIDASRFAVTYRYDAASGALKDVINSASPGTVYWSADSVNARGQVTQETLGNGIQTARHYDVARGYLDTIQSGTGGGVQNLSYGWDSVDRLVNRSDLRQAVSESFPIYDSLDRLKKAERNGVSVLTLDYSDIGNIAAKSDVGAYTYDSARPHAAATAGTTTLGYDADGTLLSKGSFGAVWSSYGYPTGMSSGGNSETLKYDAWRNLVKRATVEAGVTTNSIYVAGVFEQVVSGGVTQYRHLIPVNGETVAQYTKRSNATADTYYLHRDHLGSLDAITNQASGVVVRASFDAFGRRRGNAWTGAPAPADLGVLNSTTSEGYTGHRMMDSVSMIHMRGRVYDPSLGRMISADPTTPNVFDPQSHNRYSYVRNNPLSLVDPTGFSDEDIETVYVDGGGGGGSSGGVFSYGGGGGGGGGSGQNHGRQNAKPAAAVPDYCGGPLPAEIIVEGNLGRDSGAATVIGGDSSSVNGRGREGGGAFGYAHGALTAASFVPSLLGAAASLVDGGLYGLQGEWTDAGLSIAAAAIGVVSDAGIANAGFKAAKGAAEIVAKNGTRIGGFTRHGVDRAIGDAASRAGTKPQAILDALKNPSKIAEGVDKQGRPFQIFTGQNARVVVNPETGQIVSVNPLSRAGAQP
ncbi:FG-GAP-like repeat-containing protein [Hydrocarboniphaga sp.]|uniref:FG-GAP-like repeat-containing protein n=1 Tax=Hydrocarboniphaga sp. TaxID=2033016 RepID=UPI003D0AFF9E